MWRRLFALAVFAQLTGLVLAAPATAGTCSGAHTPTTNSYIFFDASAETCTIGNSPVGGTVGDILWRFAAGGSSQAYTDDNLDGTNATSDNQGCTIGDDGVKPAGGHCEDTSIPSGTYSNNVTAKITATKTITLTVGFTIVSGTSTTINSATFTIVDSTPASSSDSGDTTTPAALQASVSRSQTVVVATNVGSRITAIGSPVGVSRSAPGGVGRDAPGGVGRTVPGGGGAPAPTDQSQFAASFSTTSYATTSYEWAEKTRDARARNASQGMSFRELAMRASFDTSAMVLAASPATEGTDLPTIRTRQDLPSERPWTVWGHGSYSSIDNDRNDGSGDSRYDGGVWGYNLGADYRVTGALFAGLSLGYSETDLTTTYNSGDYDETNWSVTPYAVYQPTEALKFSFLGGYSGGNLDQTRNSGSVTSSTDTAMWFLGVTGSYKLRPSDDLPLDLTMKVGILAAHKEVDAYTESDGTFVAKSTSNTHQILPGLEAAYTFDLDGTVVQPYVNVEFVYDLKDKVNDDGNAYDLGGGVRLGHAGTGLSGTVEFKTQVGRADYQETTISGMVAYGFALDRGDVIRPSTVEPFVQSNFTGDAQTFETGLRYQDGSGRMAADLNLSCSMPGGEAVRGLAAMLNARVDF